jgi:hypothetical protein
MVKQGVFRACLGDEVVLWDSNQILAKGQNDKLIKKMKKICKQLIREQEKFKVHKFKNVQ